MPPHQPAPISGASDESSTPVPQSGRPLCPRSSSWKRSGGKRAKNNTAPLTPAARSTLGLSEHSRARRDAVLASGMKPHRHRPPLDECAVAISLPRGRACNRRVQATTAFRRSSCAAGHRLISRLKAHLAERDGYAVTASSPQKFSRAIFLLAVWKFAGFQGRKGVGVTRNGPGAGTEPDCRRGVSSARRTYPSGPEGPVPAWTRLRGQGRPFFPHLRAPAD